MKKVVLTPAPEIDWSKPQWVISKTFPALVVLTNGQHGDNVFTGTALPCESYPTGCFASDWGKLRFTVLTGSIPFTISNED